MCFLKRLKDVKTDKTYSVCGTPEYLSPEVILGLGYNKSADWWAVGIIMYELLTGTNPFYSQDTEKLYELICHSEVRFPRGDSHSSDCQDLILKLLDKNSNTRMGKKDLQEIKTHPFFSSYNFDAVANRKYFSPFPNLEAKTENIENQLEISTLDDNTNKFIEENKNLFNEF